MFAIGLTGGIGSGKSTAAQWFAKKGIPVLDADKTVHRLLQSDAKVISELVQNFGPEILAESGQIIRSKLGILVFNDEDARERLERIVHPRVVECMKVEQTELQEMGAKVCVWDVPLLFEAGMEKYVDEIWVVWVPRNLQILRVLERDKLSLGDVEARINAQKSLDEKRQWADVVIDNSSDRTNTVIQIEEAWQRLVESHKFNS